MGMESIGVKDSRTLLFFSNMCHKTGGALRVPAQNVAMVALVWSVVSFHSLNKIRTFETSFAMMLQESPLIGEVAPKPFQLLRCWARFHRQERAVIKHVKFLQSVPLQALSFVGVRLELQVFVC